MKTSTANRFVLSLALIIAVCVTLSMVWNVSYIHTLIGFSAWTFVGHLVTADEDAPGGWSNPDGKLPFPWLELGIKAAVFAALCFLAFQFPLIRSLGGAP